MQQPISVAAAWRRFVAQRLPSPILATQIAAIYSTQIEGSTLDLHTYLKTDGVPSAMRFQQRDRAQVDALVRAYAFARQHTLNEKNLLRAHLELSTPILSSNERGVYRSRLAFVMRGRTLVYIAPEPYRAATEMRKLMNEVRAGRQKHCNVAKSFYFASLLHLRIAHLHPFSDGNGRTARLAEKWLLASLRGAKAWRIPSEFYYAEHLADYYTTINVGNGYDTLNYKKCVPFLSMLPRALELT